MRSKIYLMLTFFVVIIADAKAGESSTNQTLLSQSKSLQLLTGTQREKLLYEVEEDRLEIQTALLNQLKSTDVTVKCYAAYLLGEYRFSPSASDLAQLITLRENFVRVNDHIWFWGPYPAAEALIKIGGASMPSVIGNLAESDDPKVRTLSLEVLYRIEGDKDIVHLRLQKSLAAQKDSQKQVRLQLALKALGEASFPK